MNVCVCVFGWSFNFDIITYFHSLPCTLKWKVGILFYHSLSYIYIYIYNHTQTHNPYILYTYGMGTDLPYSYL